MSNNQISARSRLPSAGRSRPSTGRNNLASSTDVGVCIDNKESRYINSFREKPPTEKSRDAISEKRQDSFRERPSTGKLREVISDNRQDYFRERPSTGKVRETLPESRQESTNYKERPSTGIVILKYSSRPENVESIVLKERPSTGKISLPQNDSADEHYDLYAELEKFKKAIEEKRQLLMTKTAEEDLFISQNDKIRLNDSLSYDTVRPFTPEEKVFDAPLWNPPMLPKSRHPTLQPEEPQPRNVLKPPLAPMWWTKKIQNPDFFEKSSFVTEISDEEKDRHLRSFIERNRDRLWKFDLKFIGKSPGKVYRELANDYHLIDKMKSYHHKENIIKMGSSEKVTKCLKDDHLKSIKPEIFDPFKISMKPTIDMQKNEKISRLFAPSVTSNFKRGYRHEPEFGNFSTYVHILKKNEPSALKR